MHRDVKPSNVVITERGQVKVLDFGLVKQIAEQSALGVDPNQKTLPSTRTRSDVIVGTPLYLSPEQATGKTVDGRSDLFALGVVLYECITGQSAFGGGSVIEIGAQVIHVTPPVPSKLNDHIPPELDRITMKAIEKKPENRYQTADELIEDLQRVLPTLEGDDYRKGRSTEPLPKQRTHSASAFVTITDTLRRPRLSLGTVLIAVFAVALVGWGIWKLLNSPDKPTPVALDWYNKGTDAMRNGASLQASKAFEKAIAADSKFALAHARLAEAWFELDYTDKAMQEVLRAQSLAPNRSRLAQSDALYLDAISATVLRDFPVSINAYTKLVKLSPNDPSVYLDLGRAYEKSEDAKKAIEGYTEAANRNPQYATAFLRMGSLYARQLNQDRATSAFDNAETIYQASGNYEGLAEVSFQRGYLFDKIDKFPEARQHLQRALDLAKTTNNEYLQVKTLQKLGDVEIDANNLPEARKLMLGAIALAQAKGIDNLVKRGLVDLGNTYLAEGKYDDAEKYVKQSLDSSEQQKDARNSARARLVLASIAERVDNHDEAIAYLEQTLPFYQQGGYRKELLQALALFGRAKVQKGEYAAAGQAFEQELKLAQQFEDQAQEGLAQEDLGLVLFKQGRYPEALEHLEKSGAIAKSLKTIKNIGLTSIERANALWRLGRYDEARVALNEAAPIAELPNAAKNLSTAYYLALARLALTQRQFGEAQAKARKALDVNDSQIKSVTILATATVGSAQALSGAPRPGQVTCQEALATARQSGDPAPLSEALLSLADAMFESGDSAGALKNALEAQDLFARSGKQDSEWLAWLIAARASRSGGDNQKGLEYATHAEQVLSALQQQWGDSNYNEYLNRPDVKLSRKQLSELIAGKT